MKDNYSISTGVKYKDSIFFYDYLSTALYKMNCIDGETVLVSSFEDPFFDMGLYGNAFLYGHTAWFIPNQAMNIACVDLETYTIQYFPIKYHYFNEECFKKLAYKYRQVVEGKDGIIYLIPTCMDSIVEINMSSQTINFYFDVIDVQNETIGCGAYVNERLWMFPLEGTHFIEYDIRGNVSRKKMWGGMFGSCTYAINIRDTIAVFSDDKSSIIMFDTKTEAFEQYKIPSGYCVEHSLSTMSLLHEDIVIARCFADDGILIFNIKEHTFKLLKKPDGAGDWSYFANIHNPLDENIIISTCADGEVIQIDNHARITCINSKYNRQKSFDYAIKLFDGKSRGFFDFIGENGIINESRLRVEDYIKFIAEN